MEGVEVSCCVRQFLLVEPRVSSSGETWQAKLFRSCNNSCCLLEAGISANVFLFLFFISHGKLGQYENVNVTMK